MGLAQNDDDKEMTDFAKCGYDVDRNVHMQSLNDKVFFSLADGWNINFIHITYTCTITEKHFQKDKLPTTHINKLNTLLEKDKLRNCAQ